MFEFLPDWVKAIFGVGAMVFIGIAGFSLTSKNKKGGSKTNSDDTNK